MKCAKIKSISRKIAEQHTAHVNGGRTFNQKKNYQLIYIIRVTLKILRFHFRRINNATRVVVVPLVRVISLLLHNLQDLLACVGAVLRIAVDGNSFLQRADVILAVHVDTGARHLCDLSYSGALPTDYRADHVRLDENTKREVGLPTRTGQSRECNTAAPLAAASSSALRSRHLHFQRAALVLVSIQMVHSPVKKKQQTRSTLR